MLKDIFIPVPPYPLACIYNLHVQTSFINCTFSNAKKRYLLYFTKLDGNCEDRDKWKNSHTFYRKESNQRAIGLF